MNRVFRKDFNNIDLIKVCMSVLVVATHTGLFTLIDDIKIRNIVINALAIKVPFFFTASGFLVWNKICTSTKEDKLKRIISWIRKTIRLYLIWTLIYLPFTIYGFYLEDYSFAKSCIVFIRNILFVGQNYLSWPLWYLLGMFFAGGMVLVMVKRNWKNKSMYMMGCFFAILGVTIQYFNSKEIAEPIVSLYYKLFYTTRNGFFEGFPYILIGMLIASNGVIQSKRVLIGIFVINFVMHMLGIKIATFIVVYSLFSYIIQLNLKDRRDNLYKNLRLTSTIVYFVHMLYVGVITIFFPDLLNPALLFLVVVFFSFMTAGIVIKCKEAIVIKLLFR